MGHICGWFLGECWLVGLVKEVHREKVMMMVMMKVMEGGVGV